MSSEQEFWDAQSATLEKAKLAVLSEGDWDVETKRHLDIIEDRLQPWALPSGPIVEIGCGVGRLTWSMANSWEQQVVGLDISRNMIAHAELMYGPECDWLPRPTFELMTDVSFAIWQPAGVYSMLVIQHMSPAVMRHVLGGAARSLRRGGRMVLQFVEGDEQGAHSFDYSRDEISDALGMAVDFESDWMFPQWTWATAVKP